MIHALITIIFNIFFLLFLALFNNPLPVQAIYCVFFFPACFYIGREVAQAEYRYIEMFCNRQRKFMPTFAIFNKNVWNLKSFCDFLLPILVSILLCIFYVDITEVANSILFKIVGG